MRGHQAIIKMRLAGYKPSKVWLLALQGAAPRAYCMDAENVIYNGGQAEVHIAGDEIPGTMDFRFLSGLTVLLQGCDKERLRSLYARLREFDPASVIVSGDGVFHTFTEGAK
ncbi:hypothetical protein ACMHYO_14225 [Allopusillimonas ginsengisoli]|uniref:hypothetical protein n=1 Tax=Allopusillimonas ginsengisoli TaxID=453575 RepID=UPI0039C13AD3